MGIDGPGLAGTALVRTFKRSKGVINHPTAQPRASVSVGGRSGHQYEVENGCRRDQIGYEWPL